VIEIAEKIGAALVALPDRIDRPPSDTQILAAMKAAGLVEIRIGIPGGEAVGFMLKSVAEQMTPTNYSMGWNVRDEVAAAEPVPAEFKT
jgi:hypothetical protein